MLGPVIRATFDRSRGGSIKGSLLYVLSSLSFSLFLCGSPSSSYTQMNSVHQSHSPRKPRRHVQAATVDGLRVDLYLLHSSNIRSTTSTTTTTSTSVSEEIRRFEFYVDGMPKIAPDAHLPTTQRRLRRLLPVVQGR